MNNWYVAKVKPQKERFLINYLRSKEVETYAPRILRVTRKGRSAEALFPTYRFCRCDPHSHEWPMVRWAPGVSYFLGGDEGPTRIPDSLIDYLRNQVKWWNEEGVQPALKPGARVRVVGGPLDGLEGIFQTYMPARQRCVVLLQTVNRLMTAEVPYIQLQSAASAGFRLASVPTLT